MLKGHGKIVTQKDLHMEVFTTVTIKDIKFETPNTRSFFFDIPKEMTWSAGSQIHFALPDFMKSGIPDKSLLRHMSIMTLPSEKKIAFTTRVPGSGSEYKKRLSMLVPGDKLVMFKSDNRIPLRREGKPIIFISMGVGVATFRPMIFDWIEKPFGVPSITNIVVDKKEQFLFKKEFEANVQSNLTHVFCENRTTFYANLELFSHTPNAIFYIVGSDSFLEDVIKHLKTDGIHAQNIEIDKKPDKIALLIGE